MTEKKTADEQILDERKFLHDLANPMSTLSGSIHIMKRYLDRLGNESQQEDDEEKQKTREALLKKGEKAQNALEEVKKMIDERQAYLRSLSPDQVAVSRDSSGTEQS